MIKTLRVLDLQDNYLGLAAAGELGRVLPLVTGIKQLLMRNCNIGSNYASHIFQGLTFNKSIELISFGALFFTIVVK